MLSYCLKYQKNPEPPPKLLRLKTEELFLYQNVQYVIVKNRHLLNSKKLQDY